jgi:Ca-activated chloride channel family protein
VSGVPALRSLAIALATWGLLVLHSIEPEQKEPDLSKEPSQHLLIALDVSPSMYIEDAGPEGNQTRTARAAMLLQAIMDRLDMTQIRVTVVAFYTTAMPVVIEAFDLNVVANVLNGLPMEHAFEVGQTRLQEGVQTALDFARVWPAGTGTLIVVSDGDTVPEDSLPEKPISITDTLVIGVGDPHRGSPVAGRTSRQDEASLKRLAVRLGGVYHNGNRKHLPSDILAALEMRLPTVQDRARLKDLALASAMSGGTVIALLPLALALFGAAGPAGARQVGTRRSRSANRQQAERSSWKGASRP